MNDLISQIERKTISFSAYESYKFFKDLALVYMGNHGYDLAFQYADKSKHEREQMAIDAMELPAKQAEQRDWIPVTERLPEIDYSLPEYEWKVQANVVFRAGKKIEVGYAVYASNGYAKTEKGRAPRWEDQSGRHFGFEILYWMPLPALPEQEGR